MGSKAAWRSINASIKRAERNAQRRRRELQNQQKQLAKMQEQQRNQYEVAVYGNYVDLITSVHKESSENWDWDAILNSEPPPEPQYDNSNERTAQAKLDAYKPMILDKMFGQAKKMQARLAQEVEAAKRKGQAAYDTARQEYEQEYEEWKQFREIAAGIQKRDLQSYVKAVEASNPFADIKGIGSRMSISTSASWYMEVTLHVNGDEVIPKQEKSLTSTGKLSVKNIPEGRRNEIYQDYICGCVLRAARELFALLPIDMVFVHALAEVLDRSTGHLDAQPIVSVAIPRATLTRLNFDTIDCSDSLKNFVHNMSFSKTKGFSPVERVDPATFTPPSTGA